MKENQVTDPTELWQMITTALKAASDAGKWAFWRERFNSNHPESVRFEEIENPTQFAMANWFAAKGLYCMHKDILDKHYELLSEGQITSYPGKTEECEFFAAMRRVVEEDMSQQLEDQILKEETNGS